MCVVGIMLTTCVDSIWALHVDCLGVYSVTTDLQERESLSATRAGQEDCREVWEEHEEGSTIVWSLQGAAVSSSLESILTEKELHS